MSLFRISPKLWCLPIARTTILTASNSNSDAISISPRPQDSTPFQKHGNCLLNRTPMSVKMMSCEMMRNAK